MDRDMIRFQAKCQAILNRVKGELDCSYHDCPDSGCIGCGLQSPDNHAPDKIRGTDEPSEGQAMGSERADEGES